MRALDDIVLGFGPARVAREPALLSQTREVLSAGEQLVHIGLMAGVEDDGVAGAVEDPVERHGQLDDAEIGTVVATGAGNRLHEELADLLGQGGQVALGETFEVLGAGDLREKTHPASLDAALQPGDEGATLHRLQNQSRSPSGGEQPDTFGLQVGEHLGHPLRPDGVGEIGSQVTVGHPHGLELGVQVTRGHPR